MADDNLNFTRAISYRSVMYDTTYMHAYVQARGKYIGQSRSNDVIMSHGCVSIFDKSPLYGNHVIICHRNV